MFLFFLLIGFEVAESLIAVQDCFKQCFPWEYGSRDVMVAGTLWLHLGGNPVRKFWGGLWG